MLGPRRRCFWLRFGFLRRVLASACAVIALAGGLSGQVSDDGRGPEWRVADFAPLYPAGMVLDFGPPVPGAHRYLETLPEVVARSEDGAVLTVAYLGRVSLTGGQRPLDYYRRGRVQYLREYLATVPEVTTGATLLTSGLIDVAQGVAGGFEALRDGEVTWYYRVLIEPHVLEISYRAQATDEALGRLRLENFLNSLSPPLERR